MAAWLRRNVTALYFQSGNRFRFDLTAATFVNDILNNGLRLIVQEHHEAPVVAVYVWINTGSADETATQAGMAHVLEHMVFKGTGTRGVGDIAKEVEGVGGEINAWTSFDETVYHVVMPSRYAARAVEILADAVIGVRVEEEELQKELSVILEELTEGEDAPGRIASKLLFQHAFRKHPYGRPVIGFPETVRGFKKRDVESFHQTWYCPSNMTVIIVGDVDRTKMFSVVERAFRRAERTHPHANRPQEPTQKEYRQCVTAHVSHEAYLNLAFHIPPFVHDDTAPLDLLSTILTHGDSSRLQRVLRRERGVVTDVYAYAFTSREPGLFVIGASVDPEKTLIASRAVAEAIVEIGERGVTRAELVRAKAILESDFIYQKETVQGQARKLGFFQSVAGDIAYERTYQDALAHTTVGHLQAVAKRYLTWNNATLSLVVPKSSSDLKGRLKKTIVSARFKTPARRKSEKDDPSFRKIQFPHGARLIVKQDSSVPLLSLRAAWLGGLRYENDDNSGISNLIAGLMTRGTKTRSANEIYETIEGMAGGIGGFSGRNSLGLRCDLLAKHWSEGLDVVADCLLHAEFPEEEVVRIRREALEDMRAQKDDLSTVAFRLFYRTLYRTHPYHRDVLGTESSVKSISRRELHDFYATHCRPENLVLAVVGDVDIDEFAARCETLFDRGSKRKAKALPRIKPAPAHTQPVRVYQHVDKQQAHLIVGYSGTTLDRDDRVTLEVITGLLSGQSGRLFMELRDRQGLAYRVDAFSVEGIEPGHFAVYMATSPDKLETAISGIDLELEKLCDKLVSSTELERVKRYLIGTFEISLQRRSTVATQLAFNELYGLGYRAHLEHAKRVSTVTREMIKTVARRYFKKKSQVIAIVEPSPKSTVEN